MAQSGLARELEVPHAFRRASTSRRSKRFTLACSACFNRFPVVTIAQLIPLSPLHLRQADMVLRQTLGRHASRTFGVAPATRRGLASPASGSFQYQTGEAAGVKFASRDLPGPTATVALVAKAGTRYQSLPGLAEGLEKYAFRVWWTHNDKPLALVTQLIVNALRRTPTVVQLFDSNAKPSSSVLPSSHTTLARALSLEPNSSAMIFLTSSRP